MDYEKDWDPARAAESLALERTLEPSETAEDLASRLMEEALPGAVSSIVQIAMHCPHEKTRLDAAKYIVDRNFGRLNDEPMSKRGKDDPLYGFLGSFIQQVEVAANASKK